MTQHNRVLSLLGLALRGGRLAVGEEPAALAAKAGQARLLLTASDAAENTLRRAERLAEEGHCLYLALPFTKAELGGALGRGSAAVAALTDLGLAAAVAERLAQSDPERYGEAAARMELKRRRAAERKAAPRRAPPEKDSPPPARENRPPRPRREGGRPGAQARHRPGEWRGPERRQGGGTRERPQDGGKPRGRSGRPGERPGEGRPGRKGPAHGRPPRRDGRPKPPSGGGRNKGGGR